MTKAKVKPSATPVAKKATVKAVKTPQVPALKGMTPLGVKSTIKPVRQAKKKGYKPFERVISVLLSGKPVTVAMLEKELPVDTRMYRMSSYIWDIKHYANGTIKVTKEGRKVSSYQLMNVDEVQSYMIKRGLAAQKQAPAVQNLQDLKAEPVVTEVQETTVSA